MYADTGGHLEFRTMQNGVTFVERWSLRVPELAVRKAESIKACAVNTPILKFDCKFGKKEQGKVRLDPSARRQDQRELVVSQMTERGGEVLGAEWGDGTSWFGDPTGVFGTVVRRDGTPVSYAVLVPATGDTIQADSVGHYSLAPTLPGRYQMTVIDTAFQACLAPRSVDQAVVIERGWLNNLTITLAEARGVSRDCAAQRRP
jgi:hypothetical protein